ncbi:MAG TPA: hypothetical protein VF044_04080, partial [Actinomycetota bacterium]
TGGAPVDPASYVTISNSDGVYFDWSASLGIDAVIVKGGNNANLFAYAPEATGDTRLHAPVNPSNGQPYAVSHVEFCDDYEVDVSKTAVGTYERDYSWSIEKSVSPETWDVFKGDTASSAYSVGLDRTEADRAFAVSGSITISNPHPTMAATITSIADVVTSGGSSLGTAPVTCGVTLPYALGAGQTLECTYTTALGDTKPAGPLLNTATVATTGVIGGGTATAPFDFDGPPSATTGYASVTVSDSFAGSLGTASGDKTFTYGRTFTCPTDASAYTGGVATSTYGNTATIVETGQSDTASVTVDCHLLQVSKNVSTSYDRDWTWSIDKTGGVSSLSLAPGQQFVVGYSVAVSATMLESGFGASGTIDVHNPAPIAAVLNGVADVVSPDIAAAVDCGVTFPHTLAAGGTLTCSYTAALPDKESRTNTATATLQNHAYAADGTSVAAGTTAFEGTAAVSFLTATVDETDECVNVSDDRYGILGTVCASDSPRTFEYVLTVGGYEECGTYEYTNVASFITNDTGATGSDGWTVDITVPCGTCTLTPGYWKTHSQEGPAPYDDNWANLGPLEEDTPFFLSGKTYYEALWTSPAGNAYWILAHAYVAAELNMLNGSTVPSDVQAAFDAATALLGSKTPAQAALLKGSAKNAWINAATVLDDYNNGLIGPGHCSE